MKKIFWLSACFLLVQWLPSVCRASNYIFRKDARSLLLDKEILSPEQINILEKYFNGDKALQEEYQRQVDNIHIRLSVFLDVSWISKQLNPQLKKIIVGLTLRIEALRY